MLALQPAVKTVSQMIFHLVLTELMIICIPRSFSRAASQGGVGDRTRARIMRLTMIEIGWDPAIAIRIILCHLRSQYQEKFKMCTAFVAKCSIYIELLSQREADNFCHFIFISLHFWHVKNSSFDSTVSPLLFTFGHGSVQKIFFWRKDLLRSEIELMIRFSGSQAEVGQNCWVLAATPACLPAAQSPNHFNRRLSWKMGISWVAGKSTERGYEAVLFHLESKAT